MTARPRSRRGGVAAALIVAGVLVALGVFLGLAGFALGNVITLVADLALATGFVLLALGPVAPAARIAFLVGAVGWLLLALGAFVAYPQPLWVLAVLAAAVGGVVGAIVLYRRREVGGRVGIALLVTTIVGAVLLLAAVAGMGLDVLGAILSIAFAAGLVLSGILIRRAPSAR